MANLTLSEQQIIQKYLDRRAYNQERWQEKKNDPEERAKRRAYNQKRYAEQKAILSKARELGII